MTDHTTLVTTTEAAAILGVPADTISKWKQRQLITPRGLIPGPGRAGMVPLYELWTLEPLADEYHQQRATRRDVHP